jgi:hypothetical protein
MGVQYHHHRGQQQNGQAREGSGSTALAPGRRFLIVFFHLLDYPEQRVGGNGISLASTPDYALGYGSLLSSTHLRTSFRSLSSLVGLTLSRDSQSAATSALHGLRLL